MSKTKTKLGWHIVGPHRRLGFGDGRFVKVGVEMKWMPRGRGRRRIEICANGMHASPTIGDASSCWKRLLSGGWRPYGEKFWDAWLCRVSVRGVGKGRNYNRFSVYEEKKFVGTHRTILGMIPLTELRLIMDERKLADKGPDQLLNKKSYRARKAYEAVITAMEKRNRKSRVRTRLC